MLIRASFENILSYNSRTEILLTPGKTRNLKNHIIKGEKSRDIDILKSSIIYGANASGKSNFIKVLSFFKKFVVAGNPSSQGIHYKHFKLEEANKLKSSRIEVEFKVKGNYYAYGFVFNKQAISEEWLYKINKESENKIFERVSNKNSVEVSFGSNVSKKDSIQRLTYMGKDTNNNELFLHSSNKRNLNDLEGIDDITNAYYWFNDILTIIFPRTKFAGIEVNIDSDVELKNVFNWFLTEFKTGIAGLETKKVDLFSKEVDLPNSLKEEIAYDLKSGENAIISSFDNVRYNISKSKNGDVDAMKLMTSHKLKNQNKVINFEIKEESDGTQRIIDLIPALMEISKENKVYIIDEIERSLHPNLTHKLFELFFNESNNIESQLICTTHEDILLDLKLFRKDEIWFVKKNSCGESSLYSLEEFKPRKDKDIRTGYLKGRFEAIPVFSSQFQPPWNSN